MSRARLAAVDIATIRAELQRRGRLVSGLARMRDRLQAKVVALDARIADWGGTANGAATAPRGRGPASQSRRRGRGGKDGATLATVLAQVLKGRTMSVSEAGQAAIKAGYRTKSRSFRIQVNTALLNEANFRKVARGQYTSR